MKLTEAKKEPRWRGRLRVYSPFIAIAAILGFIIGYYRFGAKSEAAGAFSCTPDAQVLTPNAQLSRWDARTMLWITLTFGHFTFATAKALDFAWDLVVGRGGQVILVYWSYPLLRRTLLLACERSSISLPLYASMAFDRVSVFGMWSLIHSPLTATRPSRYVKQTNVRALGWGMVALPLFAYLMVFPSLMSIMTGYQAELVPYVRLRNGDLTPTSRLGVPSMVVVDGSRVGLPDLVAAQDGDTWTQRVLDYHTTYEHFGAAVDRLTDMSSHPMVSTDGGQTYGTVSTDCYDDSTSNYTSSLCSFTATAYVEEPSDCGTSDCTGFTVVYALIRSTLNVQGQIWNLADPPLSIAFNGSGFDENYWSIGSLALNSTGIRLNNQCQPTNTYVWGFSYLMLLLACVVTLSFMFILGCLYCNTYLYSPADTLEQSVSMYQDILDVAAAIRGIIPDGEDKLTAAELESQINGSKVEMKPKHLGVENRRQEEAEREKSKARKDVESSVRKRKIRESKAVKPAYAIVDGSDELNGQLSLLSASRWGAKIMRILRGNRSRSKVTPDHETGEI